MDEIRPSIIEYIGLSMLLSMLLLGSVAALAPDATLEVAVRLLVDRMR